MAVRAPRVYTPDEYLEMEMKAEFKSEYIAGHIYAMDGATAVHALITANLIRELGNQLKGKPCRPYAPDLRVQVDAGGMFSYPHVAVVCGKVILRDQRTDVATNPTALFEVLSKSTEGYDRGEKAARYRKTVSLQEYVFVSQDRVHVEVFTRQADARCCSQKRMNSRHRSG